METTRCESISYQLTKLVPSNWASMKELMTLKTWSVKHFLLVIVDWAEHGEYTRLVLRMRKLYLFLSAEAKIGKFVLWNVNNPGFAKFFLSDSAAGNLGVSKVPNFVCVP